MQAREQIICAESLAGQLVKTAVQIRRNSFSPIPKWRSMIFRCRYFGLSNPLGGPPPPPPPPPRPHDQPPPLMAGASVTDGTGFNSMTIAVNERNSYAVVALICHHITTAFAKPDLTGQANALAPGSE